jgi:type I restriction enzyme, S subunit
MNRINKLTAEFCREGVEFLPLGSLGRRNKGISITAAQMKQMHVAGGPVRVFAGGATQADVEEFAIPAQSVIREPSIVVRSRGHVGFTYYDQPFTHKNEMWSYALTDPRINQRFIYYYLLTRVAGLQALARATSVKLPQLSVGDTDRLRVPVPPLEVQREIVTVLDAFTELEAELEARRSQYEHYNDSLLASPDDQWATLGDVAAFKYGYTASAALVGDYRIIRITDINSGGKLSPRDARYVDATGNAADYLVKAGDLLVARTGASYGKTMFAAHDMNAVYASFLIRVRVDESRVLPGYYWHFAQSGHYWRQADALVSTGGQPQFNANVLKAIRLPLPPLDEQQRVVAILDKFDALVSDLSIGLPAELKVRQQQYEHYRDRLLTFREAA